MAHASTYQPKTAFTRWLDSRLPIVRFTADFMTFPNPRNLGYLWTFGAILLFPGVPDLLRRHSCDALYAEHRACLRFDREADARRELRLAHAVFAHGRRLDV